MKKEKLSNDESASITPEEISRRMLAGDYAAFDLGFRDYVECSRGTHSSEDWERDWLVINNAFYAGALTMLGMALAGVPFADLAKAIDSGLVQRQTSSSTGAKD